MFPDIAGVVLALNVTVKNMILVPFCLILMGLVRDQPGLSPLQLICHIIRRPMVIGLLLGLAVSILHIPIPASASRMLQMLAASASALVLFVIVGHSSVCLCAAIGGRGTDRCVQTAPRAHAGRCHRTTLHVNLRLIPIAKMHVVLIPSTATPMFSIYPVLAQEQGLPRAASIAIPMATSAALFTLST
ncbi:hypothetical protein [Shimia abyssi]|nr:hypothetical protein [Shimia abyssi]